MSDVFISHAEEDSAIALQIADALEQSGYSAWTFERDSIPGMSYLLQTARAVEQCRAVVVVISRDSLGSRQVTVEIVRGHETDKPFVPVLVGISHLEFTARQPEWREAMGAATSVAVPPQGVQAIVPRILAGLLALGIAPSGQPADYVRDTVLPAPPTRRPASRRLSGWPWRVVLGVAALAVLVAAAIGVRALTDNESRNGQASPPGNASSPAPAAPASTTSEPVDAATTPLRTNSGAAEVVSARIADKVCPPAGFPGPCEKPTANQFLVLTLRGEGSVRLTIGVNQEGDDSYVLLDGRRYNPATFADETGGVVRIVYTGLPASAVGKRALLFWPNNPPFDVRLTH